MACLASYDVYCSSWQSLMYYQFCDLNAMLVNCAFLVVADDEDGFRIDQGRSRGSSSLLRHFEQARVSRMT